MFKKLIQKLKENPRTIVFTEGTDARILEASSRLLAGTFLKPILIGNEEAVRATISTVQKSSIRKTMTAWMRWLHRWLNFVKVK